MQFTWIALMAATFGTVAAEDPAPLDIQVYDYANLEAGALGRFALVLREVLETTGVPVHVTVCRGSGTLADCTSSSARPLMVRILAGTSKVAANARREPLGDSYADASGGTLASVFVAAAREQAAANVDWVPVLSHAAAHEIGHLLLGVQAHAPRGLMKASWDRSDYLALSQKGLRFTPEQVRVLVARYAGPSGK